ncbi:MAG TPA: archease [Candidatus Dependentiae bacterium]|nr:archease [Candidatus Dependentiae bacterium]
MKDFELLPHTADIKLRAYGASLEELFKHALQGMFQSISPQSEYCVEKQGRLVCKELTRQHEVEVRSADQELLLVDFLSEALYLSDIHNEAYFGLDIHILTHEYVKATVKGVPITGFEVVEIKAVTYNDLKVEYKDGIWQADVVFDI